MKVLGIVCSPRPQGNTQVLMEKALASAQQAGAEVEMLSVVGKTINPCDGCEACKKTDKCHIKDDMQDIYPKLLEADGIIFGTPVYFWNVTAQAKAIIDRTYLFMSGRRLRDKVGAAVVVTRRAAGSNALTLFQQFFNLQRMIYAGGALAYGDNKGDVKGDERGMAEAKAVGRVVVRYINRYQKSDRQAPIEQPTPMPRLH